MDPGTDELVLLDCRAEKPAGIILSEEEFRTQIARLDTFMAEQAQRLIIRWRLYGFVDQQVPGLNSAMAGG